jgi:transcriptional regulator GlxA family with amidase domain
MRIHVLAFDRLFDAGLALVLDTFDTANALATAPEQRVEVSVIGVRRRVQTHLGFVVPVVAAPRARPDVVLVPALGAKTPEGLEEALARPDLRDGFALLRELAAAGTTVSAACTGTFVLGDAGLLDGRRATTTWWLAPCFRGRFPAVTLDDAQMLVESPGLVTAGSALAHVDLALLIVRRRSPKLARLVANHLLYDTRPSQTPYVMPDHLAHADPVVERFEQWARRHLVGFTMEAAAKAVRASERTLERRVRAVLGKTPLAFVQDLRVARAVHQLATTDDSLDEVAALVGYSDAVTLATLLRRKTGRGVRELRRAGM